MIPGVTVKINVDQSNTSDEIQRSVGSLEALGELLVGDSVEV